MTGTSCSFRTVLERKAGKEEIESSRLDFLERFSTNSVGLSDAKGNTSGSINGAGIAHLPLLRALLAVRQKSRMPSF